MKRYRKIVAAVDGSPSSMHALKEAFRLAVCEKCWMTAVTVMPPYRGDLETTSVGNIMAALRKPCEDALAGARAMAEEAGVMLRTRCEEGEPHEQIADLALAENFDLIVLGRRGVKHLERALMGSVTARVIGYSQVDLLIVPFESRVGWNRVLVATDGSPYSRRAAEKAINFASAYGGELLVLSVVDAPAEFYGEAPEAWDKLVAAAQEHTEEVLKSARSAGLNCRGLVRQSETYQAILDCAEAEQVDTIVIGSHGKTGLRRLLMGSVAEKVIGLTHRPVLVVKH